MAHIAVLDHDPELLEFLAAPLRARGHQVHTEVPPVDWEPIMHFGPRVIVLGLKRHPAARRRPLLDPQCDVQGYEAMMAMEQYPAINVIPMAIVGVELEECEIPTQLSYDVFLSFPADAPLFAPCVDEVAAKVKSRRKISGYVCPNRPCNSRLVYMKEPPVNLFCPKCGASVAIVDDAHVTWLAPNGQTQWARTQQLLAPRL